ncbi:RNase H domain-containing protein [Aphis craccivora]|uniref:RNase H domain-containing protein n=1 Tax=Aphis craccivora TaxID=307492 RepID=A0A6G0Y8P5_APHCR|nr:RNase H domain-containing protein [Aphis craccivora]
MDLYDTTLIHIEIETWHIGINDNEHADSLAGSTANQSYSGPLRCSYTDLVTLHHSSIQKLWKLEWDSLPDQSYAFGEVGGVRVNDTTATILQPQDNVSARHFRGALWARQNRFHVPPPCW